MTRLTAPWLSSPPLQTLFDLFEKTGATLRLVGGSVRDGLLGLPVQDIDLAIDCDPTWVLEFLTNHNILALPTGIDHGTITAVLNKKPYQITTLRVDVKTFGRKAQVAFTEDWVQDAQRRDFTINAIYASKTGEIFDPVGGVGDLEHRRVRFIGKASQRIQEDYLRILRFFRFSARFGQEPYDQEGLDACIHYASHLSQLARERVTDEFLKILSLLSPLYVLHAMQKTKVLAHILTLPARNDIEALLFLEKETERLSSPLLRLAALRPDLLETKAHLRLSQIQYKTLSFLLAQHKLITEASLKPIAYRFQPSLTLDLAYLQTAHRLSISALSYEEGVGFLRNITAKLSSWEIPAFPLTGHDVLQHDVPKGAKVGILLQQVEEWWLSQDLEPDKKACIAYLATLL